MAKPIFACAHPRAMTTAFERIFMTRPDILTCFHEPFGDAFYFGPERLHPRYDGDENQKAREDTGHIKTTYANIFEELDRASAEGKRLFIKDMAYYLVPPIGKLAQCPASLEHYKRGVGTNGQPDADEVKQHQSSPTIIPDDLLHRFHFTFIIRDPHYSVPSYYRCTVPPLDKVTEVYDYRADEAGYRELRLFFDYLVSTGDVGPDITQQENIKFGQTNGVSDGMANAATDPRSAPPITIIEADDMMVDPEGIIKTYCKAVGIDFKPSMLAWDGPNDEEISRRAFEKWPGFHEDVISSKGIMKKAKKPPKSDAEFFEEWTNKFGVKGAELIRQSVEANMADYEYLKQFAIKPRFGEEQNGPERN